MKTMKCCWMDDVSLVMDKRVIGCWDELMNCTAMQLKLILYEP